MAFTITKWTRHITDSGKDEVVHKQPKDMPFRFRLLDDDKVIYAYGCAHQNNNFGPLDIYEPRYGCTEIQWYNKSERKWETL